MIPDIPSQLALSVGLRDDATFDNFYAGQNNQAKIAVANLAASYRQGDEHFIYLWGVEGVGCTHLLQAACQVTDSGEASFYLPLDEVVDYGPEVLVGLESFDLLCLDHIDCIAGNEVWEEALFHLFNRIRDNGSRLLIASNQPAKQLPVKLQDLSSRLSWGVVYQVVALADGEKAEALRLRARARGINLGEDVVQFILHRSPRQMSKLYSILEQLDRASLAAKRKITIPFVKETLDW
ncbi:MAG: DnaA regulatory inactivator Hda [Motiliproteus sp.]